VYPLGYIEDLFKVRTKLASFFSIRLDWNIASPIIGRSRLVGELHDIAVLDHRIFGAHFFVHRNHQFSVQQELQQRAHAVLVRFDEFPDRGRLGDPTFEFCFSDGIAKRQSKDQYCDHLILVSHQVVYLVYLACLVYVVSLL
jgi:hypothetical protein